MIWIILSGFATCQELVRSATESLATKRVVACPEEQRRPRRSRIELGVTLANKISGHSANITTFPQALSGKEAVEKARGECGDEVSSFYLQDL